MQFAHFHWLWIGILGCIGLAILLIEFERRRRLLLQQFVSSSLLSSVMGRVSPLRRWIKHILLLMGLLLLFIALARPQWGFEWREIRTKGVDILIAVDISRSMLAEDIKPNRLERVKLAVADFLSKVEGNRLGLLPFSGAAFLLCPLTLDYEAFLQSLQELDIHVIRAPGTNIEVALMEAQQALTHAPQQQKVLVLISDGEALSGNALEAAQVMAREGVKIYTIGVGTTEGELIPLASEMGAEAGFVKNRDGHLIKSKLDEASLRQIAEVSGGAYYPLGKQGEGLSRVYQNHLALLSGGEEKKEEKKQKIPFERFQFPLAAALVMLVTQFLLTDSKRKSLSRLTSSFIPTILMVGAVFFFTTPQAWAQQNDPRLTYNGGISLYQQKNFSQAQESFRLALGSPDLSLQQDSYYNLGNAFYRQGEQTQNINQRLRCWEEALKAYEGALELNPKDEDARFNRELVNRKLDQLKKQQEQQRQNQQNHSPQQSNSQEDQNQKQNNQQGNSSKNDQQENTAQNQQSQQNQSEQSSPGSEGQNSSSNSSRQGGDRQGQEGQNSSQNQNDQASGEGKGQEQQNPQAQRSPQNSAPSSDQNGSAQDGEQSDSNNQNKQSNQDAQQDGSKGGDRSGSSQESGEQQAGSEADQHDGQMSASQAAALLDSLQGDEERMLFLPGNKSGGSNASPEDW